MTLRRDIEKARELSVALHKNPTTSHDEYMQVIAAAAQRDAHYRTLVPRLIAQIERMEGALRGLHDDNADYIRLNNLGGYDNHWMLAARSALAELDKE